MFLTGDKFSYLKATDFILHNILKLLSIVIFQFDFVLFMEDISRNDIPSSLNF